MAHGAGMAILGIPTEEIPIDISRVVFDQLRLQGIYGREMFETWYKMSVLLQSGLDIRPVITHRFGFREHEDAFAAARSGASGKVVMDWS
jgi:threonine 3-dehydrogenase